MRYLWPVLLALVIAATAVWAGVRVTGAERGSPAVQLMAFTPYMAAGSLLPAAAAAVTGLWGHAALAAAVAVVLLGCVLPRWLPGSVAAVTALLPSAAPAPERTAPLRVLTANLWNGQADAEALVALVRTQGVDLLALQEHTPGGERALDGAGLGLLLPYRVSFPRGDAGGSALFSAFPLHDGGLRRMTTHTQAYARLELPGLHPVVVESAHPCAPTRPESCRRWAAELAAQPGAGQRGVLRVLLGDFNATLDHGRLRRLIATGYRDAAASAGSGLAGTWPYAGRRIPKVTLDHVLADRRIGVRTVSVHPVRGSDHRAVYAELLLPSAAPAATAGAGD